jgi:hypothetical protein
MISRVPGGLSRRRRRQLDDGTAAARRRSPDTVGCLLGGRGEPRGRRRRRMLLLGRRFRLRQGAQCFVVKVRVTCLFLALASTTSSFQQAKKIIQQ